MRPYLLLLCSLPDREELLDGMTQPDPEMVRGAVSALCEQVIASTPANIILAVPSDSPALSIVNEVMPRERIRLIDDPEDQTLLGATDLVVVIGGGEEELEAAKEARGAGVKMLPIGSTGGAARTFLRNTLPDHPIGTRMMLIANPDYPGIFRHLLPGERWAGADTARS